MPPAESLANGKPIGPCATLSGDDTWVDVPLVDGVALLGDAAGYNNPNIGQGLSIALRDVRGLSDVLLAETDWSMDRLMPYADERRERLRRLRFTASVFAALFTTFGPAGAARRAKIFSGLRDPSSRFGALIGALNGGPDRAPDWVYTEEFRAEVLQ